MSTKKFLDLSGLSRLWTNIGNKFALKSLYNNTTINTGRASNSTTGGYSTAVGIANIASGQCAVSEGEECEASGEASHAGGMGSVASGTESLAFGDYVTASGEASVALGKETLAQSDNQFANGKYNVADNNDTYAEILGNGRWVVGTGAVRSNARTTDWQGNGWFAGDVYVGSTSGTNKDAGSKKLATEEFVSDNYIAEPSTEGTSGQVLTTDGNGGRTWTTVSGGGGTSDYTQLSNKPQINNVTLTGNKSLSDLGIAAANGVINATDLTVSNNSVNLVDYVNTPGIYKVPSACWVYTDSARSMAKRIYAIPGDIVKIEPQIDAGDGEEIVEFDSYFTVFGTIVYAGSMITADNVTWTSSVVPYEHQGNKVTTISSSSKNAQYPSAKAVYDYAASKVLYTDTTINTGRDTSSTTGGWSTAIGLENTASGQCAVSEGEVCIASGEAAHAGGIESTASGSMSFAFGDTSTASGEASTALGRYTIAQRRAQIATGRFNIADATGSSGGDFGTYAEIVGNGSSNSARSNGRTTDWNGNGWYAGNIKVGGTGYSDSNAKELATKDYIDSLVVEGAKKVMLYDGKSNNAAILTGVTQELTDSIFNYDLIVVGFNVLVGSTRVMELTMPVYPKSGLIVFCDSTGTGATGAYHIVNANTAFASGNAYRVMWGFTDSTHIRNIISNQVGWASPGICYVVGYKFSTLPNGYATEQYVDNAIASAVTSAIGGSY